MSFECRELEASFLAEEELDAATRTERDEHLSKCAACRTEAGSWRSLSDAATSLHVEWDSPSLWPRIASAARAEGFPPPREALRERAGSFRALFARMRPAFVVVLAAACLGAAWLLTRRPAAPPASGGTSLLTERALADVREAEAAYVKSIDTLSRLVAPRGAETTSPRLMAYREKLLLLDAAIADCREGLAENRFNTHLSRELLSLYREKQHTLESLVREQSHG